MPDITEVTVHHILI